MQTSLFLSLILLFHAHPLFAEHAGNTSSDSILQVEDANTIIEQLQSVVCDPAELSSYLKQVAIEDERKATEKLDNALRKMYKFHEQALSEADREKMLVAAILGTRKIKDKFRERWTTITSSLRTDSNPYMKALDPALQPHIEAVLKEYDLRIAVLEHQKNEAKSEAFTGIACAACNVGYQPLSKGLKDNGLARGSKRDKKDCPKGTSFDGRTAEFGGKTFTVGLFPNGEVQLTEKGANTSRKLELPKELSLLKAIDKYYDDHSDLFKNASEGQKEQIKALSDYVDRIVLSDPLKLLEKLVSELNDKRTQKEKFEHTMKRLAEFEKSPGLAPLKDWMEKYREDGSKEAERQKLIENFGIPLKAVLKSDKINNRWAKGYTVDYSMFEGGPKRNEGVDNELRKLVLENLKGPSGDANHVLLNLTGACFYCDAALWQNLKFP